jgi:uncharacterized protein
MGEFNRLLKIELSEKRSAFLWGARQTGKSHFLKTHFPHSRYYDLLQSDLRARLEKSPHELREEIIAADKSELKQPIIIDEIQKVPSLLDEVHWLIENTSAQFILCGSSARKLRKQGVNLLGGRALRYHFYPLIFPEIPNFDLLTALNRGLLPSHYLSTNAEDLLESYVIDYLNEEIREEGLVRDLPNFARFLDSIAFTNGEMTNYNNIARDCGVNAKTVENYYQILVDTLLGYFVPPYKKKVGRDIISKTPKFYLFDVGVANHLAKCNIQALRGAEAGAAFEQFILMELTAYNGLNKKRIDIRYWRTKTGLEVDFILGDAEIALEVKISNHVQKQDMKGLIAFCEEHSPKQAYVISQDPRPRLVKINDDISITILPWKEFLARLWGNKII